MLHLVAEPEQEMFLDSRAFDVTPGAAYRLTVLAGVPEDSRRTGILSVVFLDESEVRRGQIFLQPGPIEVGELLTDADGTFPLDLAGVVPGEHTIRLMYSGDLEHWPIWMEQRITIAPQPD